MTSQPGEEPGEPSASDYDFTAEPDVSPPPIASLGDKVALKRERMRGWVAGALIALLVSLEAALLVVAVIKVRPFNSDFFALLLTGLLTPVVTLVGAVLGFYFGEKAAKEKAS